MDVEEHRFRQPFSTSIIHTSSCGDARNPSALKRVRPPLTRMFSIEEAGTQAAYIQVKEEFTEVVQVHPVDIRSQNTLYLTNASASPPLGLQPKTKREPIRNYLCWLNIKMSTVESVLYRYAGYQHGCDPEHSDVSVVLRLSISCSDGRRCIYTKNNSTTRPVLY